MFDQLLGHDGVEEVLHLRSRFGFMAFHGGSLEEHTDTIAMAAAKRAAASVYAVIQPPELRWHIPSIEVDPEHSGALQAFLEHVDVPVAVHGFGRDGMWTSLLLGGRNRDLARHVGGHLARTLPEYRVVDDLDEIPASLRGVHPRNPVNRTRGGGVQLELPPRVRGMGPFWQDWDGERPVPHTAALIDGLAAAAGSWRSAGT